MFVITAKEKSRMISLKKLEYESVECFKRSNILHGNESEGQMANTDFLHLKLV